MRTSLLLVFIISFTNVIYAQFELSVKAGLGITNEQHRITEYDDVDFGESYFHDNVVKMFGGLSTELPITKLLSVEPSIMFLEMGYTSKFPPRYYRSDEADYTYLSLPISLKFYLDENISVSAGPYVSYLLTARLNNSDISKLRNSFDRGLQFGAQFRIFKNLGLGSTFLLGLINTDKSGYNDYKSYNRALHVYTYYRFKFKS